MTNNVIKAIKKTGTVRTILIISLKLLLKFRFIFEKVIQSAIKKIKPYREATPQLEINNFP
jgi:hypothetical protein